MQAGHQRTNRVRRSLDLDPAPRIPGAAQARGSPRTLDSDRGERAGSAAKTIVPAHCTSPADASGGGHHTVERPVRTLEVRWPVARASVWERPSKSVAPKSVDDLVRLRDR